MRAHVPSQAVGLRERLAARLAGMRLLPRMYPHVYSPVAGLRERLSARLADMRKPVGMPSPTPTEPPCIPSTRASAPESQMRSERKNAFSAVLPTEGRVVGLCWAQLKPEGPKGTGDGDALGAILPRDHPRGGASAGPGVLLQGLLVNKDTHRP